MMTGTVTKSTGSWYHILTAEGDTFLGRLRGKIRLQGLKVTNPIAVGDKVAFDLENEDENTVTITEILPRDNYVVRKSTRKTAHAHIVASNIDQAVIIATLRMPRTSLGFIDRCLVTTESFRIPTTIVFNKADLLKEKELEIIEDLRELYISLGYGFLLTSCETGQGIEEFKASLEGKISLLTGHSGAGKSTLSNQAIPGLELHTKDVSKWSKKGQHTTTHAEMHRAGESTFVIDTPGIKEVGLMDMEKAEISHYFPEMRDLLNQCKFANCTHMHEPQCAVIEAVENGEIALSRYTNYMGMVEEYDFK